MKRTSLLFLVPVLLVAGCGGERSASSSTGAAPETQLDREQADPVAVVDGSKPGTSLGLLSARRTGPKVVTVKVRVFADETAQPESGLVRLSLEGPSSFADDARGMRLVDEVNGAEHFVLLDTNEDCLCSIFEGVRPGDSADLYAKFPAPPADVHRVSLSVPGFPSFDGIKI